MESYPRVAGRQPPNRDRLVPVMVGIATLAWGAVILWARSPSIMDAMPGPVAPTRAALFAGMWLVMMAAMMLPAVTPVVLLFRTVQRGFAARGNLAVPTGAFVAGYLAVWLAAGIAAFLTYALAQDLTGRLRVDSRWVPYAGGVIVAVAGVYQLTPLKDVCLRHCRSPFHFLIHGWGNGRIGAFRTGAGHGLFCLGCCWGIMAVLFVVGLMNLAWMAALSLLITVEKLAPRGLLIARAGGALFLALGAVIAFWPSLLAPSGLTMSSGTIMGQHPMKGMQSQGVIGRRVYHTTAGPYSLTIVIGQAERMLTPAGARRDRAYTGEVVVDGMMSASMPMSGMRHLELRISDRTGMPVTQAHVVDEMVKRAGASQKLSLVRMYGVREGIKDLHFGANVQVPRGTYTLHLSVNGHPGAVTIQAQ